MCSGHKKIYKSQFNDMMIKIVDLESMAVLEILEDELDLVKDEFSLSEINFAYELLGQKRNALIKNVGI